MSFENEPLADLRIAAERERLLAALATLDGTLPVRVPVIIGEERRAGAQLRSTDPGRPDREVALAAVASAAGGRRGASRAPAKRRPSWGALPAGARAEMLRGAAANMRSRRHELAALAVRECAKPWREADADVCEAIDFLEYYALAAVELESGGRAARARRRAQHAALAAAGRDGGDRAVELPVRDRHRNDGGRARGRQSRRASSPPSSPPAAALAIVEALRGAGVPAGALSLLPGDGELGARLVADPRVATIAFTGSGAVGREIMAARAPAARA